MLLVILFFMHVRSSTGLTKAVVAAGFLWLAILISLTLCDFRTRDWTPPPAAWDTGHGSGNVSGSPAAPAAGNPK